MSLTRRHPTPHAFRAIPRWQAHPDVVRFEPHQELVGCLPLVCAILVFAGGCGGLCVFLWSVA